jgi:rhodanese-related sulfurtransferase
MSEMIEFINSKDCVELLNNRSDINIIDVRDNKDYQRGHLPNASNLDIMQFGSYGLLKELNPADTYLLYCNTGLRSNSLVRILQGMGFLNVYILRNGLLDWAPELLSGQDDSGKPV